MLAKTLDFESSALDHLLQISDEFFVYRVVGCAERVEGGRAGSVQDPEHAEVLRGVRLDSASCCRLRGQQNRLENQREDGPDDETDADQYSEADQRDGAHATRIYPGPMRSKRSGARSGRESPIPGAMKRLRQADSGRSRADVPYSGNDAR